MTVSKSSAPCKPSRLRFSSSPSSPLPVGTVVYRVGNSCDVAVMTRKNSRAAPPPKNPLPWLWKCHLCHRTYKLSVTIRCLEEGHIFCSGTASANGRHSPRRSCNSEFDYSGWSAMHEWRRQTMGLDAEKGSSRNCWLYCDYPSECRWGQRISKVKEKRSRLATIKETSAELPKPEAVTVQSARVTSEGSLAQRIAVAVKVAATGNALAPQELDLSTLLKQVVTTTTSTAIDAPTRPYSPLKQHYQLPQLPQLEPISITPAELGSDKDLDISDES